jgi:hypothetical protein
VGRLSTKGGSPDIPQPYGLSSPVTGIALPYCFVLCWYYGMFTEITFKDTVIDLIQALLGNTSVDIFQYTHHATIEEAVFSMCSMS